MKDILKLVEIIKAEKKNQEKKPQQEKLIVSTPRLSFKTSREEVVELAKKGDLRAQYTVIDEFINYQKGLSTPEDIIKPIIDYMHELLSLCFTHGKTLIQLLPVLNNRKFNKIKNEWYSLISAYYSDAELKFLKTGVAVDPSGGIDKIRTREATEREARINKVIELSCTHSNSPRRRLSNKDELENLVYETLPTLLKKWGHIFVYVED